MPPSSSELYSTTHFYMIQNSALISVMSLQSSLPELNTICQAHHRNGQNSRLCSSLEHQNKTYCTNQILQGYSVQNKAKKSQEIQIYLASKNEKAIITVIITLGRTVDAFAKYGGIMGRCYLPLYCACRLPTKLCGSVGGTIRDAPIQLIFFRYRYLRFKYRPIPDTN